VSSRTRADSTLVPRSTNSIVSRIGRDCAVLWPPQPSTFTVRVRPVGLGADGKSQGSCVLICDDFHASYCTLIFVDAGQGEAGELEGHSPDLTSEIDLL
jgi:hypothetical protein